MNSHSIVDLTALEQAALVRSGDLSSEELVRFYLDRIARHESGPQPLGAFVQVLGARALREARVKDRARRGGQPLPPFHGVPIGIKDLNLVAGARSRFGSRAWRYLWSPLDDRTVAQLRRGGFVILGKLATSEFGAMPVTETDLHPPARNPWDPMCSPGGSSGGSGAAVAAGLLPLAQGSDGGGSVRLPSSFCGLYGIKPSRGRLQNAFGIPDRNILYTDGPLARTVGDAAAMLDVMAGVSVGKPHWAPPPPRPFAQLALERSGPLRIRFATESKLTRTDPEVSAAVLRGVRALEALGHQVEEAELPEGTIAEFLPLWQRLISGVPLVRRSLLQPITRWLAEEGSKHDARAMGALYQTLRDRFLNWFGDADLWVTPTSPHPPPLLGAYANRPPREAFFEAAELGVFTAPFNITGQPAASVPIGFTGKGLPIGLQLAGRPLADATVLQVSRQLEEALPWRDRKSPAWQR